MKDKVVNFREGAKVCFQWGNYYYQKNKLDKALDCYRKAADIDPLNPVNHFNLACLLSELGKYKESNRILKRIVTEMDSDMSESWFWLAMNHGQQQQYKQAYQYLRKYLELAPEGEYSWQAREIMDYLRSDASLLERGELEEIEKLCRQGIQLVSQGKLREAIRCFTRASNVDPDLAAPRNNLALTWFYLGEVDRAIAQVLEVLDREPENIFANCNLATFYYAVNDHLGVRRQLRVLEGLWSEDADDVIKLGTTLGLLGRHRRALALFRGLREEGYKSFELLLLLGIAACNCGLVREAEDYFRQANGLEPDNPYRGYLKVCRLPGYTLPYHMQVPDRLLAKLVEGKGDRESLAAFAKRKDLWPCLLWLVKNGTPIVRQQLVEAVLLMGRDELVRNLGRLAWDEGVALECRCAIFQALAGADIPVWEEAFWRDSTFTPNACRVLAQTLLNMRQQGWEPVQFFAAHDLWRRYLGKVRRVTNPALWSAALLVFVSGLDSLAQYARQGELDQEQLKRAVHSLIGI